MADDARPVVVAYDGSPEAQAALRAAAALFSDRPMLVVSVWEPGLAYTPIVQADTLDPAPLPTAEEAQTIDHLQRDRAGATARSGVELARGLGREAVAIPAPDDRDIADTVVAVSDEHDAAAIVVGSRGLGGLRSAFLGSTSRRLLHDTRRPVLVVRA
jgi:nucleotide-binding universal stress UspA family protein